MVTLWAPVNACRNTSGRQAPAQPLPQGPRAPWMEFQVPGLQLAGPESVSWGVKQ